MTTDEMQQLAATVWRFRAEMADVWPTPDTLDSLRFAFTEAGEAMDAYLRTKGGYARNHERQPTVNEELADCALMLFTALGPDFKMRGLTRRTQIDAGRPDAIDMIAEKAGSVLWEYVTPALELSKTQWQFRANDLVYMIHELPGMDLAAELGKRLERIRAKHRPG